MARILMCLDHGDRAWDAWIGCYEEQIRPSLMEAGHSSQLSTCVEVVDRLADYPADVLLLFIPRKRSFCWQVARSVRETWDFGASPLTILIVVAWGPEDSPDNPAYYAQPEYIHLYDGYCSTFGDGIEIARWVDGFLRGERSE